MKIQIPNFITDEEIAAYVAGYLHDRVGSGLHGADLHSIEIVRTLYKPGVPANLYPDTRGFAIPVPPTGMSVDEVLICCRSAFVPKKMTLVEEARVTALELDGNVGLLRRLADEVERLERAVPNVTYDDKSCSPAGIHGDN